MTDEENDTEQSDVFISYSHDDSRDVVQLLAQELDAMGLEVWYDEIEMSLGDSIRDSIDKGLRESKFGVVVLSEGYFEGTSEWELNGLVKKHNEEGDVILPLWHGVDHEYVYNQSASLADLKSELLTEENAQSVASKIYRVVEEDQQEPAIWGGGDEGPSAFVDVDIRFQGNIDLKVGREITIKSWRNHNAPNFSQLEAVEIRDEERGINYPSDSKGMTMSVSTITDEPLEGVVSDIQTIRSGKMEFTVRLKQARLDDLPDDRSYYRRL